MHHAKETGNNSVAFTELHAISPVMSNTDVGYQSDMTIKMNEGTVDGLRQTQWDVSLKVNRELFTSLTNTFYTLLPSVQDLPGAFPTISIQAITEGQLKGMQKNGGNALGLKAGTGPFFIMNMSARWSNAADDAAILKFFDTVIKTVKADAKKKGLDNDYIYMNYGSQFQDPIASYGAANVKKLLAISKKYDPAGVFQELHPGHFKLAKGAPSPTGP
jgi:hypothetical protein